MNHNMMRFGFMKILWVLVATVLIGEIAFGGLDEGLRALQDKDYTVAMKEFTGLAEKGDTKAMVQMGLFYYEGKGTKKDYKKAMDWFLNAFSKQDADAFVNIGVMCRDGQGVPVNKKIAYCIFLTTHMCGLGSESTQYRANSCLRRIMDELSKEDIKDCLSNYTLGYMTAYIEARGELKGIPDPYKPSKENPALRDLDWWTEGELDALYGEPTPEEKKARLQRSEQREMEREALEHTLITQIRIIGSSNDPYRCSLITDEGIGSGALDKMASSANGTNIYEKSSSIGMNQWRYIALESADRKMMLVYEIKQPAKPVPCDWTEWLKPAYSLADSMDIFSLCNGGEPKSKSAAVPTNAPQLRFKVLKE